MALYSQNRVAICEAGADVKITGSQSQLFLRLEPITESNFKLRTIRQLERHSWQLIPPPPSRLEAFIRSLIRLFGDLSVSGQLASTHKMSYQNNNSCVMYPYRSMGTTPLPIWHQLRRLFPVCTIQMFCLLYIY